MLKRLGALLLCASGSFVVFSCGAQKDLAAGDVAVGQFHKLLDNEEYTSIYNTADQRFRNASKQDDFIALMAAVHKKLGHVESASRQGFFVNYTTSGTQIKVNYATKFTDGDAQEQFVWIKNGENLALLGYNINSNALITR